MIIRVQKNRNNPYVIMNKTPLEDTQLTWKAKGLLTYLLSKPDNWKPIRAELVKASVDGDTSVRGILKELEDKGYMMRQPIRDDLGKIASWEHVVYEVSIKSAKSPCVGNPHVDTPQVDKTPLISNDLISNKPIINKDIYSIFEHWNSKQIITHKNLTNTFKKHINAKLKDYTVEEITTAIDNYAEILKSDKYYLTHKWKLDEFLIRSFDKFKTESDPFSTYRNWKKPPPKKGGGDLDGFIIE